MKTREILVIHFSSSFFHLLWVVSEKILEFIVDRIKTFNTLQTSAVTGVVHLSF